MRSVQTHASAHAHRARVLPACLVRLAPDTAAGSLVLSEPPSIAAPISLPPFAPSGFPPFDATTTALSFPPGLHPGGRSPFCAHRLPTVPTPTTRQAFPSPLSTVPQRAGLYRPAPSHPWLLGTLRRLWASPFPSWLANLPGRIEFVILWTGRSPPAALHPASRRRSYVRLHAVARPRGRDFHPTVCVRSRAHSGAGAARSAFVHACRFFRRREPTHAGPFGWPEAVPRTAAGGSETLLASLVLPRAGVIYPFFFKTLLTGPTFFVIV